MLEVRKDYCEGEDMNLLAYSLWGLGVHMLNLNQYFDYGA